MSEKNLFDYIQQYFADSINNHYTVIISAKNILGSKITEEKEQYQNDNLCHYMATNMVSAMSYIASQSGLQNVAAYIDNHRQELETAAVKFDKKIAEEQQQFASIGGAGGEYVAQNLVSLLSAIAHAGGDDYLAQDFESQRNNFTTLGKKLDSKVAEEQQQFDSIGGVGGEYVAQNLVSLLSALAHAGGDDYLAQDFESQRNNLTKLGKKLDNKVAEELQQFEDMDSPLLYFTQNTISAISKSSKKMHLTAISEIAEKYRATMEKAAKSVDDRLKSEYNQFNQYDRQIGKYLAQNILSLGNNRANSGFSSVKQIDIVSTDDNKLAIDTTSAYNSKEIGAFHKMNAFSNYTNAEIRTIHNDDGSTTEFTILDGKKHGLELRTDKDGNVTVVNAFDHGNILNPENLNIKTFTKEENGQIRTYTMLNGKMFGTAKLLDGEGNISVFFYDSTGLPMPRTPDATVSFISTEIDNNLRQTMGKDFQRIASATPTPSQKKEMTKINPIITLNNTNSYNK